MAKPPEAWNLDTVPEAFWQRIAAAENDAAAFRARLSELGEDELRETYYQYQGLIHLLVGECWDRMTGYILEDSVEKKELVANWVITQGKDLYVQVLSGERPYPQREDVSAPLFAGQIIQAYNAKFGAWRA